MWLLQCALFAVIWLVAALLYPFVFPLLNYLTEFAGPFDGQSAWSVVGNAAYLALTSYGDSEAAPDLVRGFARGWRIGEDLANGGEAPIARLSYMQQVQVLMGLSYPVYLLFLLWSVPVAGLTLISRLARPLPGVQSVLHGLCCGLAFLPAVSVVILFVMVVVMHYAAAWQTGWLEFLYLLAILPAVLIRVGSLDVGLAIVAFCVVPMSLAFADPRSRLRGLVENIQEGVTSN